MGSSSWQGESSKFQVQGSKAIKAPSTGKGKVASTEEKTEGVEVARFKVLKKVAFWSLRQRPFSEL